jgi:hypothetical protein
MRTRLDPYARLKAPKQGWDLKRLVAAEGDWLGEAWPGTAERYRDLLHAAKNVGRIAAKTDIMAFVIRDDEFKPGRAVGVATIIPHQMVLRQGTEAFDPERDVVAGSDLDYWLTEEAEGDRVTHSYTTLQLVNMWKKISNRPFHPSDTAYGDMAAFAAVRTGLPNPAIGFGMHMEPVGGPARLATPDGNDSHGVTHGGAEVQLYRFEADAA